MYALNEKTKKENLRLKKVNGKNYIDATTKKDVDLIIELIGGQRDLQKTCFSGIKK